MDFQPYDPDRLTARYRRNLPHWEQPGTTYFVTFRLVDSIPASRLQELSEERHRWLLARGLASVEELAAAPEALRRDYAKTFNARWHALLDAGHGACVLRVPERHAEVASALRHWHGTRLHLDAAVVMPNHVHVLMTPEPGRVLRELLHSIKRYSARAINHRLQRTGALWLDENFDHIVRSAAQLAHYRNFIRENPVKARLRVGEYWLGSGAGEGVFDEEGGPGESGTGESGTAIPSG